MDKMLNVLLNDNYITQELADNLLVHCKKIFKDVTFRLSKLFGDEGLVYKVSYQGKSSYTHTTAWDQFPDLLMAKEQLEKTTGMIYNFCAIMMYANENVVIKKHRDKEIPINAQICGISLGATRRMKLTKIRDNDEKELVLTHGSLYQLLPPTNDFWLHEILPENYPTDIRFSLTFRNVPNPMREKDIIYCNALLKSGIRKGQTCGCIVFNGNYCGRHK